jgi:glycosyltransferase involved in cell wall biosynthesis
MTSVGPMPIQGSRRIAFFLAALRGGGAERVAFNLVQGMIERGLPVDIVVMAQKGELATQVPPGARLVNFGVTRLMQTVGPLTSYLRRERPRVLLSSMSHVNLVALWAARLAGTKTPVVVTVHNTLSESTRHKGRIAGQFWASLIRNFYPWAASVIAVSKGAADDLVHTSGVPAERVQVVYNPVITEPMLALARQVPDHPWFVPGEPPVVLGVGRLTQQKDFPTLIRAFAKVRRCRAARLIILGEGPDRVALEALVAELGLNEDVILPGFRDNALAYMAASSVFVLSSAWEGLPTVLIEALAAGTRVVATDCPSGPREILQEGRLGALVPVGDVAALACAIGDALDRPLATVPLEALSAFTRDTAVDHYLQVIEKVS